jgi:hypothetical protein
VEEERGGDRPWCGAWLGTPNGDTDPDMMASGDARATREQGSREVQLGEKDGTSGGPPKKEKKQAGLGRAQRNSAFLELFNKI